MTFIISFVCVEPLGGKPKLGSNIVVEEVSNSQGDSARAAYVGGLSRHFSEPVNGTAYCVLTDEGDGYMTSNRFFPYPEDEMEPVALKFEDPYREDVERLLRSLVGLSAICRVLVVSEYNGSVTTPDPTSDEETEVELLGPMSLSEFWVRHDLGEIVEHSVVVVEAS